MACCDSPSRPASPSCRHVLLHQRCCSLGSANALHVVPVQVAVCRFQDPALQSTIAILQRGMLLTHSWKGETNHTPLPARCRRMHSLPQGLLLSVRLPAALHAVLQLHACAHLAGASHLCRHE